MNRSSQITRAARVHASVLLVCLLLSPAQMLAATWLQKTPACCLTMCPMHKRAPQPAKSEPLCHHESEKKAPECTMGGCGTHENSGLLPMLPETVLTHSISTPLSAPQRYSFAAAPVSAPQVSLSPPDQPPRA